MNFSAEMRPACFSRIASKTLEVHSVDTYEAHLRAYMAKRRASLEGSPAEAKIEF